MKKGRSVIALLTDFGLQDAYVAAMKGVILGIAPEATLVDITHSIKPQNISQAAYLLWSAYRCFPKGTIFFCVVDPGVGSARRIICARGDGYTFLAPDNGLLTLVLNELSRAQAVDVKNPRYFRPEVSRTFHGRDIFAPVAAQCARGIRISALGPRCTPIIGKVGFTRIGARVSPGTVYHGTVLHVDSFGNIITNFKLSEVPKNLLLRIGNRGISSVARSYSESAGSVPFMIRGSTGLLEISVKNGSAARELSTGVGRTVTLRRA